MINIENINYVLGLKPISSGGGYFSICDNLCHITDPITIVNSGSGYITIDNISYDTTDDYYLSNNNNGIGVNMVISITINKQTTSIQTIKIQNFGDEYNEGDSITIKCNNNKCTQEATFRLNKTKSAANKCDITNNYMECLQTVSPSKGCRNLPPIAVTNDENFKNLYPQYVSIKNSC